MPSFGVEGGPICSVKRSPKSCSNEEMITDDEVGTLLVKTDITNCDSCYLHLNKADKC